MKSTTSFGSFAEFWDAKTGNHGVMSVRENIKLIFSKLGNIRRKTIYEIACGNGFLSRKFADKGARVYASDIAPELIHIAKTKYAQKNINYFVREGTDVNGFEKDSFDAVIIHQGIFFIKDINNLFKNVKHVLKPKGLLIFTITHPLFPAMRVAMQQQMVPGKKIDLIKRAEIYRTQHRGIVERKWIKGSVTKNIKYWNYNRPLSYYVNLAAKHGLLISNIDEPKSIILNKDKKVTSSIPSTFIVTCKKILS